MNKFIVLLSLVTLVGCGNDRVIYKEVPVPGPEVVIAPEPPTAEEQELAEIQAVVDEENAYRESLGQLPIVPGLVCTLYTVPNGTSAITGATLTSKAVYTYKGAFNQPEIGSSEGINILPPALRTQYTTWYVVKCRGQIIITESDYYQFDLSSDDGSLLFLDNVKLVDNDGNHGVTVKSGTKLLRRGIHAFELDYMQGPGGNQQLSLSSGGSVIPSEYFYR